MLLKKYQCIQYRMSTQTIFDILNMHVGDYRTPIRQVHYSCELSEKNWVCKQGSGSNKSFNFIVPETAIKSTLEARLAMIPVIVK